MPYTGFLITCMTGIGLFATAMEMPSHGQDIEEAQTNSTTYFSVTIACHNELTIIPFYNQFTYSLTALLWVLLCYELLNPAN